MATINISITDLMREQIDARVASGMYANASDYLRDLIRHDQTRTLQQDALTLALIEGENSGVSKRKVPDIIRDTLKQLEEANG